MEATLEPRTGRDGMWVAARTVGQAGAGAPAATRRSSEVDGGTEHLTWTSPPTRSTATADHLC